MALLFLLLPISTEVLTDFLQVTLLVPKLKTLLPMKFPHPATMRERTKMPQYLALHINKLGNRLREK
jgi:hypothetical protein